MADQFVPPHVVVLNEFLAARDWDHACRLLGSGSLVTRWAAWRSLLGAAAEHEGGYPAARDRYLASGLAIICALDTAAELGADLREQVAGFWSCAGSSLEPPLRPGPWRSAATARHLGASAALSDLSECKDLAQAADVIAQEPSLWTLQAVGAAAIDGHHAALAGESTAGDRLRFAVMLLERVALPQHFDTVEVSPVYSSLPQSLIVPLTRALAASAEQGEALIVTAVRQFAEVFAAPEAEALPPGWRAALLGATVPDDLYWLYEAHGMTIALEWSLALAERSLADPDLRAEARASVRNRCFRALKARYEVHSDPADLDAAIRHVEEALSEDDGADEAINNLAMALRSRRRPDDLDRAIDLIESRLESARPAGPGLRINHAVLLHTRYVRSSASGRRLADISRAVESAESAEKTATGPDHRIQALLICGQLAVCQIEAGPTPGPQDPRWAAASASFGEAVMLAGGLGPQSELHAAHGWGLAAGQLGDWETADGALGIALSALERVEAFRPAGELRDAALPGSYALPATAALAKIRSSESMKDSGLLKDAIVILDRRQARQLVFSGIGTADPADPSVAAQMEVVRRQQRIEHELTDVCSPINLPDQFDLLALSDLSKALALLADLADAATELAVIRAGQLATALSDGDSLLESFGDRTVVYIASALETGFALIAGPPGRPVRAVYLPDLANDAVVAWEGIYSAAPPGARGDVCSWLWDAAIQPLVARVGPCPEDLWIVPTSVLGTFPLHAARRIGQAQVDDLLEETTVRYLPASRLLRTAQERPPAPAGLAILAAPDSSYHPAPLLSIDEAAAVHAAWPGSRRPLIGFEVTGRALVDALAHAEVLHLSCGGHADPAQPLNSRVYLAGDETMTMADLRQVRTGLTLAVLSACETGVIGHGDYDEALGLPAALLAGGCRGVICTLWAVPDQSSALLFARFYQLWPEVHQSPARALRGAQRWLRATCAADIAAEFPALYCAPSASLPASRLKQWARCTPFAHPDFWAGFCYVGT